MCVSYTHTHMHHSPHTHSTRTTHTHSDTHNLSHAHTLSRTHTHTHTHTHQRRDPKIPQEMWRAQKKSDIIWRIGSALPSSKRHRSFLFCCRHCAGVGENRILFFQPIGSWTTFFWSHLENLKILQSFNTATLYRVVKTRRILCLYRSFSAKEP